MPGSTAAWVAVVCVLLLALLTAIQVVHVHLDGADTRHCPLCVVLQTAAPVGTAAAILLVTLGTRPQLAQQRLLGRGYRERHSIRPPPGSGR